MHCENCGAESPGNGQYCMNCGARLYATRLITPNSSSSGKGGESAVPPSPAPQPSSQPQYTAYDPSLGLATPETGIHYSPPPYYDARREPLSVWGFMWTFLLGSIPLIGFVVLLVWAFSDSVNFNRRNYARAMLLLMLMALALAVIVGVLLVFAGFAPPHNRMG